MKTGEDFRREFPEVEASFTEAAQAALEALPKRRNPRRIHRRVAALVTVLMLIAATAAVAAGLVRRSASDFIGSNRLSTITPQAEALLEQSVVDVAMDTPWAHLTLRQAVYDGMAVYLLFEGVPAQPDYMIAAGAEMPGGDQAFSHGSGYPTDIGIREYAARQGYAGVQLLEVFAKETTGSLFDSAMNEDGTCSMMVWAFVRPEYRGLPELTLNLRVRDAAENVIYPGEEPTFTVTLPLAGEIHTSTCASVTPIPEAGLTVIGVTVHQTAMTSYILVDYEVTDASVYSRSLFYDGRLVMTDAQGDILLKGTHPLSLVVDRPIQGMGEGTYYITNRQLPENADVILLTIEGSQYTFRLQ